MMKGKIYAVLFFGLILFGIAFFSVADTGTYQIRDYTVKLTPRSDGSVEMEYYQKWLVTGGHIPWITIGMANSSYQINQTKNKGNIRRIYSYNSSNWSGVRIDLDKDYLPNETFEVGFTLIQSRLFFADKDNYKLDFTPGWYDRAVTDRLIITIHIFAPIDQVKVFPRIARIEGQDIIWETHNLEKGRRFPVSISFPKRHMPQVSQSALKTFSDVKHRPGWSGLFVILVIIPIIIAIFIVSKKASRYGRGGSLFVSGTSGRGGRSSGGGGGFGGRSSSCACACVSCACACACAGGGGAGCSKKISHSCPICAKENNK